MKKKPLTFTIEVGGKVSPEMSLERLKKLTKALSAVNKMKEKAKK